MEDCTLAYLAGAVDSDGYFTIKRSTYGIRVRGDMRVPTFSERIGLKQVTSVVPNMLHQAFGGSLRVENPSALRGLPLHSWMVTDRQAAIASRSLLPYLRIKHRQAELLLALRALKEQPRSSTTITNQRNRWGNVSPFRKRIHSPEDIAQRQELFEQIKALNDIRPQQAKLG